MRRSDREIKAQAELLDILKRGDACHLAMVDGAEPYLVTLNYGFAWEAEHPVLYFHCANEGRKLDILRRSPRVCFGVDVDHELVPGGDGCGWGMKYKSVVGTGEAVIVDTPAERELGLQLLMTHYSGRTGFQFEDTVMAKTMVLKLTVHELHGKKKA